jgi:hypothetical protein
MNNNRREGRSAPPTNRNILKTATQFVKTTVQGFPARLPRFLRSRAVDQPQNPARLHEAPPEHPAASSNAAIDATPTAVNPPPLTERASASKLISGSASKPSIGGVREGNRSSNSPPATLETEGSKTPSDIPIVRFSPPSSNPSVTNTNNNIQSLPTSSRPESLSNLVLDLEEYGYLAQVVGGEFSVSLAQSTAEAPTAPIPSDQQSLRDSTSSSNSKGAQSQVRGLNVRILSSSLVRLLESELATQMKEAREEAREEELLKPNLSDVGPAGSSRIKTSGIDPATVEEASETVSSKSQTDSQSQFIDRQGHHTFGEENLPRLEIAHLLSPLSRQRSSSHQSSSNNQSSPGSQSRHTRRFSGSNSSLSQSSQPGQPDPRSQSRSSAERSNGR